MKKISLLLLVLTAIIQIDATTYRTAAPAASYKTHLASSKYASSALVSSSPELAGIEGMEVEAVGPTWDQPS